MEATYSVILCNTWAVLCLCICWTTFEIKQFHYKYPILLFVCKLLIMNFQFLPENGQKTPFLHCNMFWCDVRPLNILQMAWNFTHVISLMNLTTKKKVGWIPQDFPKCGAAGTPYPPLKIIAAPIVNTIEKFSVICAKYHKALQTKIQKWAWLMTICTGKVLQKQKRTFKQELQFSINTVKFLSSFIQTRLGFSVERSFGLLSKAITSKKNNFAFICRKSFGQLLLGPENSISCLEVLFRFCRTFPGLIVINQAHSCCFVWRKL